MKREEAKEALSALMDGELGKSRGMRVLDVVADDEELIRTWRAYHLARDVLRREADVALGGGIAEAVRTAIAREPVPFAPRRAGWPLSAPRLTAIAASLAMVGLAGGLFLSAGGDAGRFAEDLVPGPVAKEAAPPELAGLGRESRAGAGFEAESSDAFAFSSAGPGHGIGPPSTSFTLATTTAGRGTGVASRPFPRSTAAAPLHTLREGLPPSVEARLNAYLVNHAETSGYRTRAIHPYARLVAHDRAR